MLAPSANICEHAEAGGRTYNPNGFARLSDAVPSAQPPLRSGPSIFEEIL